MGSSPFHGIFAALAQGQEAQDAAPARSQASQPARDDSAAARSSSPSSSSTPQVGRVAVDIFEQDDYFIIKAPIAGVRMSDIDLEVNDNVLTIRGQRKQTDAAADGQYFLRECFWGSFARSITLPMSIDPRKIKATFNKDCVLKILVPKEERVKIVKISEA